MAQMALAEKRKHRQREPWQDRVFNGVILFLTALILLVTLYPIYLVIISSISSPNEVALGNVTLFPRGMTLAGYQAMLENTKIWSGYLNSVIYTVAGTLISLLVTMMAAFALTRKFRCKGFFSFLFVFTMFFNGGLIPTFLTIKDLGLYNTRWICILMGCVSVWNTMLARTYISTNIPESLYEAAHLDGASIFQCFVRVVMPLCGTILGVLTVYYGVAKWNDYWTGLIYIKDNGLLPLQTVLKSILATLSSTADTSSMTADMGERAGDLIARAQLAKYCVIVVSTAPAVALYLCMQRFFVKGVMIGSVKG